MTVIIYEKNIIKDDDLDKSENNEVYRNADSELEKGNLKYNG